MEVLGFHALSLNISGSRDQGSSVEIPQIFLAKILSESSFRIPSSWTGCKLTYIPTNMQPENGQPESEKIPWEKESKKG